MMSTKIREELSGHRSEYQEKGLPRILNEDEIDRLLAAAEDTRYPERNRVIVLLACEAGLKAREIAYVRRYNVLTDRGVLGNHIDLSGIKRSQLKARKIPIGYKTRFWWALHDLLDSAPALPRDPLIISERALDGGGATKQPGQNELKPMRPTSIAYIFFKLFEKTGIDAPTNCGRNTFVVNVGRKVAQHRATIRDMQEITGYKTVDSIKRFFEYDQQKQEDVWDDLFDYGRSETDKTPNHRE